VVIIGGEHGDVPLEPHAGKLIAEQVVDHPGFYVIDMSLTTSGAEQDRFACDFAEHIYRYKATRKAPLQVFVDEADSFAPQRPMPGQQRMLGAYEAIVRRGRLRGLGMTMITQRAAVLNKNVLTQCEMLMVLQTTGPQDQDAILDWVDRNASKKQSAEMMDSLASLPQGSCWVWSPAWLKVFKKVAIRARHTFNSSATPEAGQAVIAPKLAEVDLAKLTDQIKAAAERVKENDPAKLKAEIARLKRELAAAPKEQKPVERRILVDTELHHIKLVLAKFEEAKDALAAAQPIVEKIGAALAQFTELVGPNKNHWARPEAARPVPAPKPVTPARHFFEQGVAKLHAREAAEGLGRCDRAILAALAQYPQGRTANQMAILAGYAVNSGGFNNSLSKLRSSGFINRGQPIQITEEGLKALGPYEPLPTGEELRRQWLGKLGRCEQMILQAVCGVYPEGMTSEALGAATGYAASSGGFNNALSRLRTLELIERGQPIKASANLFD
jgi:hypothetical protein